MMLFWSDAGFKNGKTSTLSFLVAPLRTLAPKEKIKSSLKGLKAGTKMRVEGPFGSDLDLRSNETVILTAKGRGITGILPCFLLSVAETT